MGGGLGGGDGGPATAVWMLTFAIPSWLLNVFVIADACDVTAVDPAPALPVVFCTLTVAESAVTLVAVIAAPVAKRTFCANVAVVGAPVVVAPEVY